jgi:hypothetical protein
MRSWLGASRKAGGRLPPPKPSFAAGFGNARAFTGCGIFAV